MYIFNTILALSASMQCSVFKWVEIVDRGIKVMKRGHLGTVPVRTESERIATVMRTDEDTRLVRLVGKKGHTDMYLQALGQFSDGLLQEECHEQEVKLRHIGVFGQQRLQHRESWEMAGVAVYLAYGGPAACAATHVKP